MADDQIGPAVAGAGGGQPPPGPPVAPAAPPPPPPLGGILTPQNIALLVFAGLALAIIIIAIFAALVPAQPQQGFLVARLLDVLLVAAVISLTLGWLSPANTQMLGTGFRHLLSIHRAAIASFVLSSAATIGILFYVVAATASSAEIQHGLYLLAAIEFLLKLTAVSAIIVLITLRRAPVIVPAQPNAAGQPAAPPIVVDDQEERGRLEFGSLAFAFGLVVIAGLVVPTEDLMRLTTMFFGDDKAVEDYLPARPLVTVEQDLSEQIAQAVLVSPLIQNMIDISGSNESLISEEIRRLTDKLISSAVMDGVQTVGAYPLLAAICEGNQDDFIFPNSDDRLLAEHLSYLLTAGLVEYPYGDIRTLKMTPYGVEILMVERLECEGAPRAATEVDFSGPVPFEQEPSPIDTAQNYEVIDSVPHQEDVAISAQGTVRKLALTEGQYAIHLQSVDLSDPLVELYDGNGNFVADDDDSGTQGYDALLTFRVAADEKYFLRAVSFNGAEATAALRVVSYSANAETGPSLQMLQNLPANPLPTEADIPVEGSVFAFTAIETGEHVIHISLPPDLPPGNDLVATLYRKTGNVYEYLAEDDDTGLNSLPIVAASLMAGDTYYLAVRHYDPSVASPPKIRIAVYPRVAPVTAAIPPGANQGEASPPSPPAETPAPDVAPAPAAEPASTDSPGS